MNWKKFFTIFSIVMVVGGILFYLAIVISFSGGLSGFLLGLIPEPDWNSTSIQIARSKKEEDTKLILNDLESQMGLNYVGSSSFDKCVKGDHGWKRNDSFAYECSLNIARYYSFDGDFRVKLVELDAVLVKQGWEADWRPMSYMLQAYYDDKKNSNFGKTGLVSSLPTMTYVNRGNNWTFLKIAYAQKGTADSDVENSFGTSRTSYNQVFSQTSSDNIVEVFHSATAEDKYFLVVSTGQNYYRK